MENYLTLSELNERIGCQVEEAFPDLYWIVAELFDVRVHGSGHCYMELIEKEPKQNKLRAKASGIVWAQRFLMLRSYFESETGQAFASGLKVLVQVSVQFHPLYGYSLIIHDIDPSYTLGDMARRREEIVRRLKEEGVYEMNKELPFPRLPQRIAVISSPTAAGYEDFVTHLKGAADRFAFSITLFPAYMQGDRVEQSVISALEQINRSIESFDVVVIIRGGGASSDLSSFDTYELCAHCAQFPLPIISGIGHERDETLIDQIAHTRVKTPTAAAGYLLNCMEREEELIRAISGRLVDNARRLSAEEHEKLRLRGRTLCQIVRTFVQDNRGKCELEKLRLSEVVRRRLLAERQHYRLMQQRMPLFLHKVKQLQHNRLLFLEQRLRYGSKLYVEQRKHQCDLYTQKITLSSPECLLEKGYALVVKKGRIITSVKEVKPDDRLVIYLNDGNINTIVTE